MNQQFLEFAQLLLHDAITARVKNSNRSFRWLVRNPNHDWLLYREEPSYNKGAESYGISVSGISCILRENRNDVPDRVPIKIDLDDYRPCKLGTMNMGGREVPNVKGGGNVFNFIEDIIDQTYEWYIDNDIERPASDPTRKYGIDPNVAVAPKRHQKTLEEQAAVDDADVASDETIDHEEDPFALLYRRDPKVRVTQWAKARNLEEGAGVDVITRDTQDSRTTPSFLEESELTQYLKYSVPDTLALEVFTEEIPFIVNMVKALPSKYNHIRRTTSGQWIADSINQEINPIIFYYNPTSPLCPDGQSTVAFKLKPALIRANYNRG